MKKKVLVLMVGFLFIGVNVFAADGDLTVDGNVGIGTTDPAGKLDISGGRFYLRDRGDNCCTDFRMSQGSGQETHLYSYADGRFGIHKYGAGSASGEVFSILKNGNVGIGTTSPGLGGPPRTVLHLYASAQAEMLLNSGAGSGRTWSLNVPAPGTSFRIGRSGVADDVTIDNSGNVGIGMTSPGAKLDVNGDIKVPMVDQWCSYGASPGNPTCTCPSGYYAIYCGTNHYIPMTLYNTGTGCYAETGPASYTDQYSALVVRCAKIHQ